MEEAEDTSLRHACEFDGCQKSYSTLGNMRTHMKTHTGDLAYKCGTDSCGKAFLTSYSLKVHTRSHTGEKPYVCDDQDTSCRRAFASLYRLRAHKRVHTGDLYQCSQCAKSFITRGDLRKHERTHSGARPFACPVTGCDKAYTTLHHLKVHVSKHERAQELMLLHTEQGAMPLLEPIVSPLPPLQRQVPAAGAAEGCESPMRVDVDVGVGGDDDDAESARAALATAISGDSQAMAGTSFDISDVMSMLERGAGRSVADLEYDDDTFADTFNAAAADADHPAFPESLDLPPPLTTTSYATGGGALLLPADMLGISTRAAALPAYGGVTCAGGRAGGRAAGRRGGGRTTAACCQAPMAPVTACCGNPFPTPPPPSCCLPDCKCCCCLPHKNACRAALAQEEPPEVAPSPLFLDGLV